jgi:UDP-N-acetylmuramate: L-alanyl-gamma-D-glutamyl-meso-diaminopimelate ligase
VERFASAPRGDTAWYVAVEPGGDYSAFAIMEGQQKMGEVSWSLLGRHNAENALAAVLAARHAGVELQTAIDALREFKGVRRRMEVRGVVDGITVYDDFAHHPTAIATTIDGLRRRIGEARLIAVLEPRSNTMKLGSHRDAIAGSLAQADRVWLYQGSTVKWDVADSVASLGDRARVANDIGALVMELDKALVSGDHVLIMSNGGFEGIHAKLLARLRERSGG